MRRRRARQLELDLRRARRGGARPGAGRKRAPGTRKPVPHRERPAHAHDHPLHVTMRAAIGGLRAQAVVARVVRAIARANERHHETFRVLHFSVQHDHVHLVAEAESREDLMSGMRGLAIRLARTINVARRRRGRLWADRYHTRALTSPRAVRNALVYVLANHKKHRASAATLDPCASGAWFDGWRHDALFELTFADVRMWWNVPPPTAPPSTWLARAGWRRRGRIRVDESPVLPG